MGIPSRSSSRAVDAVIVGAGAAGSLFAARFAAAGRSVLVLEAGPAWQPGQLVSSQLWSRRLKWGGAPVLPGGSHPFGYTMSAGWGLGGAALHHYAGWPRLHPEDFETRRRHGRARDWPIAYEALRPHYDRIQREMGVSGDAEAEPWRPPGEPYPQPPLPVFRQGHVIAGGFAALGQRVAPAPLAILTAPVGERAGCLLDGWCDAGCPTGALANPLVTHIPRARALGARFETQATVTRVLLDGRGRAAGVLWRDARGEERRQAAGLVVLAASSVQNVRLLLASAESRHPRGLGNARGLVGTGFTCHTIASAYGVFDEPLDNHLGVSAGQQISQENYRKDLPREGGGFGSYQWGIAPALKPNDLLGIANTRPDLYGAALQRFLEREGPRIGTLSAVCETLPSAARRIELAEERDRHGVPLARIVNVLDADALALHAHANAEGRRVLEAAGARVAWNGTMAMTHALGGTVMGEDPADSVCDPEGRVHDVPRLVVAGGSLFPTAGGGSPTFTIYALADRATTRLAAH
ncbi:MAG: GMC family oxidoreductase [Steroidobacteraceae bacterium]|jgi:choline dehydrogenase-like flavoprotein|nr:GMC family oxidoreductase [Steroidobacteraceae bacterium]